QIPRVRAEIDGGTKDSPYVQVQIGSTLVYAYDLAAVRTFARAWADAASRPVHLLPEDSPCQPATGCLTAVSVTVRGEQRQRVLFVAAQASPDGRTHLLVTVGPLTVAVYDRAALDSYIGAWTLAVDYARRVFVDPEPDAFDEIAERERQRELRHFERTGQLLHR
ncbi:MAG TPA: hypothetical protein VFH54_11120, partial [Mycobacteriales bacterium]|nr:hypothetical protein [Mycobacteriales bacterium]